MLMVSCVFLICILVYWNYGSFVAAIYAEIKFDEVRFGPHTTMTQVDNTLSWFDRAEIESASIPVALLRWHNMETIIERPGLKFVSYYLGESGFIVVFDVDGKKLTQLKSDV